MEIENNQEKRYYKAMELSGVYDPKQVEEKIYKLWEEGGFFNPAYVKTTAGKARQKTFTIVLPPPNITGELHMGHALNTVIQDILIRQKRMQGFKTLWIPGTDHAGIATQTKVEKELKKEGLSRFDLGREKFIERIRAWREIYGNKILNQLKSLGASCDWSRTRFTLDKEYEKAVQTAFLHYYKKGWIYQGEKTVNWCVRCGTSLSDLEIEYKEEPSSMYYIRYPLKFKSQNSNLKITIQNSKFITIATTRPETMLGDTAVVVNPKDGRYKNLIGEKAILPFMDKEIPIIADESVDMAFGTGAMKVTPAHDLHDFELGEKYGLEKKQVIGPDGKMTALAGKYAGLKVAEAREKVIEDMRQIGILEKVEPYAHSTARCYRCNSILEPILSKQWFLKMNELAKLAIKAVESGQVKFSPKKWEKPYFDWLNPPTGGVKDWCISRQLWWGHQLPVFQKQEEIQNSNLKIYVGDKPPRDYMQVPDVLDTWFSSALWPFATLGWPQKSKIPGTREAGAKSKSDLDAFYPTDVLSTARDIINLWVTRMIFSGMEFMGKPPFHTVLIHPTVLTKEGQRMSKSLGTGIDPVGLIEKYGADAVRFGIAYQLTGGQDIKFTEDNIVMGRKFCNKLWNASRFVMLQIESEGFRKSLKIEGFTKSLRFRLRLPIIKQLNKTVKLVDKDLQNYRFGKAAHTLYDFFWHDFCDVYLEESKKQLQNTKYKIQTTKTLLYVLLTSLKLLHPFIPFITEEIYQQLPIKNKKKSLMVESYPNAQRMRNV